jgi:translation initiation factor 2B subunit (eIF-2B alpha/beta/delta family)
MHDNPAVAAERPTNRMDVHANNLSESLNGLERASLQCDNMLRRLRGNIPSTGDDHAKPPTVAQADPPIMQRLDQLSEQIQDISVRLNNQVDELQEYV